MNEEVEAPDDSLIAENASDDIEAAVGEGPEIGKTPIYTKVEF